MILKKSSMVFPTRAYPSRTRSVVKDTHPPTFIQKGKSKANESEVDPDLVLDESFIPNEPVTITWSTKKQNMSVSAMAKADVPSPKHNSSEEVHSRPLTRSSGVKMASSSAVKDGYESENALYIQFFSDKNRINWDILSKRSILGERVLNKKSGELVIINSMLEKVNMIATVAKPKSFVAAVIYEFYANLSP